jgi:hypothetical protein
MGRDPGAASTWCVAHAFRYEQVDVNAARNTIDDKLLAPLAHGLRRSIEPRSTEQFLE